MTVVSLWSLVPLLGWYGLLKELTLSTMLARLRFCTAAEEEQRAGSCCRAHWRASEVDAEERRDMLADTGVLVDVNG